MKSVAFLRNTWKKWEQKTADDQDAPQISSSREPRKPAYSRSTTAAGRSLTVTVKHLPAELSSASQIKGSWQPSESYQPPSPIYDQFTQNRSDLTLVRRDSGRFNLNATYRAHGAHAYGEPELSRAGSFSSPSPPEQSPKVAKISPRPLILPAQTPKTPSSRAPWPTVREKKETSTADHHPRTHSRNSPPTSPRSPSLPSFKLLPPIDLNYGPGSKVDNILLLEGKTCKCVPPTHLRNPSRCPRYTFSDAQASMTPTHISAGLQHSPKTVHAVLDLSHDAKPRSLYHNTGSTPHLPYRERVQSSAKSEASTCSVDSSEAEHFPLSLFPLPPPLIIRKKVPAPLILRSTHSRSAQSSRDSTPVGTPTTPRFQYASSPSQSSIASPTKKFFLGRPSASFSPPPFSPPNSPLPKTPVPQEGGRRSADQTLRPLRTAQSNANFKDPLPFPAMHRLTSSEPISDQSSLPIKRLAKPRPAEQPKNIQMYTDMKENPTDAGVEAHVQWGYAF